MIEEDEYEVAGDDYENFKKVFAHFRVQRHEDEEDEDSSVSLFLPIIPYPTL